jgi:hypothetical protein
LNSSGVDGRGSLPSVLSCPATLAAENAGQRRMQAGKHWFGQAGGRDQSLPCDGDQEAPSRVVGVSGKFEDRLPLVTASAWNQPSLTKSINTIGWSSEIDPSPGTVR